MIAKRAFPEQLRLILILAVTCVLTSAATALADGINIEYVAARGLMFLIPLTAFVVAVEAAVLSRALAIPARRLIIVLIVANLLSFLMGIPIKIISPFYHEVIQPHELAAYFGSYPWIVLLDTIIYFVITLVVEFGVLAVWRRWTLNRINTAQLLKYLVLANLATYAVLAPLHYFLTKPQHDIREFTDRSEWAAAPATRFWYVAGNGTLCSILTNGEGFEQIVPDTVRDYQYLPNSGLVLYRNGSDDLCLFDLQSGKSTLCWVTSEHFYLEEVACSPDGRHVAYLSGNYPEYSLYLFDVESKEAWNTGIQRRGSIFDPQIAWSTNPSKLYLSCQDTLEEITIGQTQSLDRIVIDSSVVLNPVFGRFGDGQWGGGGDWGGTFESDRMGEMRASAWGGLDSQFRVEIGDTLIVLADNPGLLKFGNRGFSDPLFLRNGNELIFNDNHDVYLMNVRERKVGRIVKGTKLMILDDRFLRKLRTLKTE